CNCKKSKCLKLYCECFQRQQYCNGCNCVECLNTERTEDLRQLAIQGTIERNPQAFVSKFERRAGKRSHNAGCNCKKSACLKKYCECFQAGVACGTNCKCVNCKNYEGAAGGRKRRAVESPAAGGPLFSSRALGNGAGGGGLSGTPPADAVAAAAAAFAAQNQARVAAATAAAAASAAAAAAASASSSPSASAVADCAVARSLLDMGGTPLQVQDEEGAEGKFELSLAAGSPASARLLQGQQKKGSARGGKAGGGGGGGGVDDAVGMD
ncbi:unnamed protein product, partial [Ectocarpus sp. 12 AP-2014]